MQTLSVPYRTSLPDQARLTGWRRVYSSAVRQAYVASVLKPDGSFLDEKTVRAAVTARHGQAEMGATLLENPSWMGVQTKPGTMSTLSSGCG